MVKNSTVKLLGRTAFRSLRNGLAQFLSIVAIGAIAVTLFVGLGANADSFESRVNEVYARGELPSLWVTTKSYDENDLDKIKEIVGDKGKVETRTYLPASFSKKDIYCAISSNYPSIDIPYELYLDEGETGVTSSYLLLDKQLMKTDSEKSAGKFSIGEEVEISFSLSSYLSDEVKEMLSSFNKYVKEGGQNVLNEGQIGLKMKITGFMDYPENITKSTYNSSVALMSDSLFKSAFDSLLKENYVDAFCNLIYNALPNFVSFFSSDSSRFLNPNQYLVKSNNESDTSSIKKSIETYYDSKTEDEDNLYLCTNRSTMTFYATLNADVVQARQFTFVFPAVFFLVAVLIILTTLSQMIVKERTQIGTLKALGLSNGQIYLYYLMITLSLVALGSIIGIIIGPLLIPNILGLKYSILYSLPAMKYVFPTWEAIATLLIFLAVTGLTTFIVCHKAIKLTPSESMRPEPPKLNYKVRASSKKKQGVVGLSLKMASRNIAVDLKKSIMVVVGVLGCTALLACGFGIEDTVNNGIDSDIANFRNDDITLTYSTTLSYEDATKDIKVMNGVTNVEPTSSNASTFYVEGGTRVTRTLTILAENSTHYGFSFDKDTVAMSTKAAKLAGAKVGDTLTFDIDGKDYTANVSLIYSAFYFHGIMIHSDASFLNGKSIKYNGALVDCKVEEVEKLDASFERLSYVSDSQTSAEWRGYISDTMSSVMTMTNAVKVFAILLAIVALYNLSLMNFRQKMRDVATLKVLGFKLKEIALSLLSEAMLLTLTGVGVGLCLGYPFLLAVMGTNQVEVVEYIYCIKPLSYFLSFVLTAVVVLIINIFLTWRIRHVKMVESLKSVE